MMSIARITEITAQSDESFDHAIRHGIDRARKTLHNIEGAWIKDQELVMRDNQIVGYRVHMKLTFILDE